MRCKAERPSVRGKKNQFAWYWGIVSVATTEAAAVSRTALTTKFTLQVDAIKVYLAKQTSFEKAATAARLPAFTEAVAYYGLDKFSDFSEALMTSLRLVNQEKIILGQETVKSYFTGCDL